MTGSELKLLRKERQMSQGELADFLGGGLHHSTISRWELDRSEVPAWAAHKMLAESELSLPVEAMQRLLTHAERKKLSFRTLLSKAITEYLAKS